MASPTPLNSKAERQIRGLIKDALAADRRGNKPAGDAAMDQAIAAGKDPKNRR